MYAEEQYVCCGGGLYWNCIDADWVVDQSMDCFVAMHLWSSFVSLGVDQWLGERIYHLMMKRS